MSEQITSAKAAARIVRTSSRRTRLVIGPTEGKSIADVILILKFAPNKSAGIIEKVLMLAVTNAENNFDLDVGGLVISKAFVNGGSTMERFHPRTKGSASLADKRTSYATVVVAER